MLVDGLEGLIDNFSGNDSHLAVCKVRVTVVRTWTRSVGRVLPLVSARGNML